MTPEAIHKLFPNASQATILANAGGHVTATVPAGRRVAQESPNGARRDVAGRTARQMNKTEARFALILEARKRAGEIEWWRYEAISLKWGDGMRYTPDFMVCRPGQPHLMIEVKGSHIWSRDTVRFRGCAAEWKDTFDFELHQWAKGEWTRLL